jgi:hypothetical protein
VPVHVSAGPQLAAALGAALLGRQRFLKTGRVAAA